MLREEQAAELLRRCESITGSRLEQIRGNLRNAKSRAAAIMELLVLEEASRIGTVEYEPHEGGSPDIRLSLPSGRKLWIEVAFLYPRFWRQERQSNSVADWLTNEAIRRNISPYKISCRFDGDRKNASGPVRTLPNLQEKKQFLSEAEIVNFFDAIKQCPSQEISVKHATYSLEVTYLPEKQGPYLSGGGLVQEAPKTIKEHAVYRVLKAKARQHSVSGVRLVCVGSDQSPALSHLVGAGNPTVSDAVYAAFNSTKSLSGAIVLDVKNSTSVFSACERLASGEIFINPYAKEPLNEDDIRNLSQMNFNRWKYFFSLEKFEKANNDAFRRVGGKLSMSPRGSGMILEIPSNLVVDSLAGKTDIIKEYAGNENDPMFRCLKEGWIVKSCSWKDGDIEAGEAPKVVFELEPPPETVYWSNEPDS